MTAKTLKQSVTSAELRSFDPIAVEVFTNRMLAITESMASNMMRASFSPQIKERRDFSVGIFDRQGRLIAQGTHIPIHLGSMLGAVEAVRAHYQTEDISDGDVYICNDPYVAGGTHLPDIAIISPIFMADTLVGFAANIGHHSDVGGATPGSTSARSTTIYAEGLRIPIMRVARNGQIDDDLIDMIALNSRLLEERTLDLRVQIATNEGGALAMRNLIDHMGGVVKFNQAVDDVLSYTLQRIQFRIAKLASGQHSFTTWLDDDGSGAGDRVPITVAVYKEGSSLVVDFAGTGSQSTGALNVAESALRATVYHCVKAMLDPDLMANSGLAAAVIIKAPEGTIVSPQSPAAVGARTITCQRVAGAIIGAFRSLVPEERLIASSNDTLPSITFSGILPESGKIYLCGETLGGGGGGYSESDGMDGIHVHITNTRNLPTEILENEFPLHVDVYGLVTDSGGAGRHRGGAGIVRQVRTLRDNTIMSCRSDSHLQGAQGAQGGAEGGRGRLIRNYGTPDEVAFPSKVSNIALSRGETVRIETPGGAGFGPPAERTIEALADDLRSDLLTREAATRFYGVDLVAQALAKLETEVP